MPDNTASNTPKLEPLSLRDISGKLRIPAYQRGYRWEGRHVVKLLDDLLEHAGANPIPGRKPYYLQPVVVAPSPAGTDADFDLIDGQQRLTTCFLIFKALDAAKKIATKELFENYPEEEAVNLVTLRGALSDVDTSLKYSLTYETRKSTETFLDKIDTYTASSPEVTETPDHLYLWHAYARIKKWLLDHRTRAKAVADALTEDVRIIWYLLPGVIRGWEKFAELNVGKIPLTNSELIKALLLRSDNTEITDEQKKTIVQQWDLIEKQLADPALWKFLTSRDMADYPTRIDLLFDIVAGKPASSRDDFFTFDYFDSLYSAPDASSGKDKWNEIYLEFQRLYQWFTDRDLYHKIGFLTTLPDGEKTLRALFKYISTPDEETKELPTNSQFHAHIEDMIKSVVKLPANIDDISQLAYITPDGSAAHQPLIRNLLTLYNVVYTLDKTSDRYDFASHKDASGGWSLEHIHAQHPEKMNKEAQQGWLRSHAKSIDRYIDSALGRNLDQTALADLKTLRDELMAGATADPKSLKDDRFVELADKFAALVSSRDGNDYEHSFANMALLSRNDNAMFNNSTFDVKRHKMLSEMATTYFPVCTRRVFLKSITGADDSNPYFWSAADRESYLADIRDVLKNYLTVKPSDSND